MDENDTPHYLVWLMLGLFSFILIVIVIWQIKDAFEATVDEQTCYQSIERHAQLIAASRCEVEPDITCPTRRSVIPPSYTDKQVNRNISAYWTQCWREWHRGKKDLFCEEGVYCHVCHVISFPERQELNGLLTYMEVHPAKDGALVSGEEVSILDYLRSPPPTKPRYVQELEQHLLQNGGEQFSFADLEDDTLPLEQEDYAIIVVYAKGQSTITDLLSGNRKELLLGGTSAIVVGGLTVLSATAPFVSLPALVVVGGVALIGAGTGVDLLALFGGDAPETFAVSRFEPYHPETLRDLGCQIGPAHQS